MAKSKSPTVDQEIYKAALKAPNQTISQDEIKEQFPEHDLKKQMDAINKLLSKNLLKLLKLNNGAYAYKAVSKDDAKKYKAMEGDEGLVFSHIDAAGTEGIWTKTLKLKTNLHQTVINRCLKSLESRGAVKVVKSVKFPTRKIYMLASLQPSVELTGGPWYTDNELDTEFVGQLKDAILKFIRGRTFPSKSSSSRAIYPVSAASSYPTVPQILAWLKKSQLTEIELGPEHIEALLEVLIYDGEVERLPAVSFGVGSARLRSDSSSSGSGSSSGSESESEDEEDRRRRKRRKKENGASSSSKRSKSKSSSIKRKKKQDASDDESGSESDSDRSANGAVKSEDESGSASGSGCDPDSDSDGGGRSSKRSKKKKKSSSSSRSRSKKHKDRSRSRSKSKSSSKRRSRDRSSSPGARSDSSGFPDIDDDDDDGAPSASVYRAVRNAADEAGMGGVGAVVGWTEAPCGRCPVFDFCAQGGPVNAGNCRYFDTWLEGLKIEE